MTPARRAELEHAYRQTVYRVFTQPQSFLLRIDEPCPHLSASEPWAFLTACNPASVWLSPQENAQRMADLTAVVAVRWAYLPGEGASPDGRWREASLWIRGISQSEAIALAESFGQVALVWGDPVPQLLWTRLADHSDEN
jgi:hypothetical protein